MTTSAVFIKLSDGGWGVQVHGKVPKLGQEVTVTKKGGSTRTVVIARIVSRGSNGTVCHIKRDSKRFTASSSASRCTPHDYPGKECPRCESVPLDNELYCWECGYKGR